MDSELKQQWLAALRSGKYEQGKNSLKVNNKYCCIGVLLSLMNGDITWTDKYKGTKVTRYYFDGSAWLEGVMPGNLRCSIGLSNADHDRLTSFNDGVAPHATSPQSFNQIADWIEEHL